MGFLFTTINSVYPEESQLRPSRSTQPTKEFLTAEIKLGSLLGAQDYRRFPLSKPVVGQNTAVHAVLALRGFYTYLVHAIYV